MSTVNEFFKEVYRQVGKIGINFGSEIIEPTISEIRGIMDEVKKKP